ncbi:hypothetical protein [Methylobacterium fujisawaense]
MTFPMLLAHEARTALILEGMNERVPGMPRDLPDMMRDLAFRRTLVHSQTALALISTHPDEPAKDMASLARHAIARCRDGAKDPEGELSSLPAGTTAEELLAIYRQGLAVMLEGANECRPPVIEDFADILSHARIRKRYLGPVAALCVVVRCGHLPSSTIARFAFDAALDAEACPGDGLEET